MPPNQRFLRARAGLKAFALANRYDLKGDLGFTQSQQDAIFSNLRTAGRGMAGALTAEQARQMAAMGRIAARGVAASGKAVRGTQERLTTSYGSALGASVAQKLGVARATVGATRIGAKAAVKSGSLLAQGGQAALEAQRTGAREAQAGADYAMAAAVRYRAGQDASLLAERQMHLDELRVQAQSQWSMFKKQQDYLAKQAADQQDAATATLISQAAPTVAQYAPEVSSWLQENPDGTWDEFKANLTLSKDDPAYAATTAVLARAFTYMKNQGMDQTEAVQVAFNDIYGQLPGYDPGQVNGLLGQGIDAVTTATSLKNAQQLPDFIRNALSIGKTVDEVYQILHDAGVSDADIYPALAAARSTSGLASPGKPTPSIRAGNPGL